MLQLMGNSPNTIRSYRSDLLALAEFATKAEGDNLELICAAYLNSNREAWEPSTVGRKVACFRKFGHFLGAVTFLAEYRAPTPPKAIAHPLPEGPEGVIKMIEMARKPEHKALITLCGMMGLRCFEARRVKPSHFDWETMFLTVRGKGGKSRRVPVTQLVITHLGTYIAQCAAESDQLLVPLSDRAARDAISRIGRKALGHDVASHDLRMTFGTYSFAKSKNIRAVQEMMGHASMDTTGGYTGINEEAMREAVMFFADEEGDNDEGW